MKTIASTVDFRNTELAFQALTDKRLRRNYWLFRMIDSPILTKIGPPLLMLGFKLGLPVKGLVRKTLYHLFAGGESLDDTVLRSEDLFQYGVHTILDYSVEGEKSEAGYEKTKAQILRSIRHGGQQEPVAFCAIKLTGLASFSIMEKKQAGKTLSPKEAEAWSRVETRLGEIADAAVESDLPVFIDAEETWIQDTIDELAESLMEVYNREKPLIWTTTQHYRHDRLAYLAGLIERSRERGYYLGVKLVRGAYLEKENDRAQELDYPTPMQPTKAATDDHYDAAIKLCVEHLDHVAVCAGTHNERSCGYLTQLIQERMLPADHPHIWFAQLLGMSDHISFNLGHGGYNAAKYLPYGPVKSVMPYLVRRAQENTAVAGQASREVGLLRQEVQRRKSP